MNDIPRLFSRLTYQNQMQASKSTLMKFTMSAGASVLRMVVSLGRIAILISLSCIMPKDNKCQGRAIEERPAPDSGITYRATDVTGCPNLILYKLCRWRFLEHIKMKLLNNTEALALF